MEDSNDREGRENQSLRQTSDIDLEARLNIKPSLDTYILDFLVIAGLTSFPECHGYRDASPEVRHRILENTREKYKRRRANFSRSEMVTETRFVNRLTMEYFTEDKKSLRDLKVSIETYGLLIPKMECKGLAYFNSVLEQFDIELIKVGGTSIYPRVLAKYGLEPSEH